MNEEFYSFHCPCCQTLLSLPLAIAGVRGPCPVCQADIQAPMPDSAAELAVAYMEDHSHQQSYQGPLEHDSFSGYQSEPVADIPPPMPQYLPPLEQSVTPDFLPPAQDRGGFSNTWQDAAPSFANLLHAEAANSPVVSVAPGTASPLVVNHPLQVGKFASNAATRTSNHNSKKALLVAAVAGVCAVGGWTWKNFYMNPVELPRPVTMGVTALENGPLKPLAETPFATPAGNLSDVAAEKEAPSPAGDAVPTGVAESELPPDANASAEPPAQEPVTAKAIPAPPGKVEVAKALPVPEALPVVEESTNPKSVDYSSNPLASARETLDAFLSAPNWKQRIKFVKLAKEVAPIMEEYYRENADGPTRADSVDYLTTGTLPDGQGKLNVFHVAAEGKPAFPVVVEEGPDGNKIDWQIFVEFKDLRLPRFFEKFTDQAGEFRVVMTRSHYFGSDVPNQDNMICFCVEPPIKGFKNYVWVDKDNTELLQKLGGRKEWGVESAQPIIAIRWVKDANGAAYVMLEDVLADNWRTENLATGSPGKKGIKVSQLDPR